MISPGDRLTYELLVDDGHAPAVAFAAIQHQDATAVRALAARSADEAAFGWWLHVCEQKPVLFSTVADLPPSLPPLGRAARAGVLRLLESAFHAPNQRTQTALSAATLYSRLAMDDELALQVARAALGGPAEAEDVAALFATKGSLVNELVGEARRRLGQSQASDRALLITAAAEQPPQQRCEWLLMLAEPVTPDEEPHIVTAIKAATAGATEGALGPARQLFTRLGIATQVDLVGVSSSRLISADLVHHLGPAGWRVLVERLTPQDASDGSPSVLSALLGLVSQLALTQAPELLLWAHARYDSELFADARARQINLLNSGYSRRDKPPGGTGTLVLLALLSGAEGACKDAALALKSAPVDRRLLAVRRDFDAQQLRQFLDAFSEADISGGQSSQETQFDPDVLRAAGAVMAWQLLPHRLGRQLQQEEARDLPGLITGQVAALLATLPPAAAAEVGRGLLGVLEVDGPRLVPRSVLDLLHHSEGLTVLAEPYWVEKIVNLWRNEEDAAARLVDYLEANSRALSTSDVEFVMRALDDARQAAPAQWTPTHDERLAAALPPSALVRELATQAQSLGLPQARQAPAERLQRLVEAVLSSGYGQDAYEALTDPASTLRKLAEHTNDTLSDLTARWLATLRPTPDVVEVTVTARDGRLDATEYTRACEQLAEAAAARTKNEHLSDDERASALEVTERASGDLARAAAFDLLSGSPPVAVRRAAAHMLTSTPAEAGDSDRLQELRDRERDAESHRALTTALRQVRSGSVGEALRRLFAIGRAVAQSEPDADVYLPFEAVRTTFQKEVDELRASFTDSNKGYLSAANTLAELLVEQGAAAYLLSKGDPKHIAQAEKLIKGTPDKPSVGALLVRGDFLTDPDMVWLSSVQSLRSFRPAHPASYGGAPRDTGDGSRRHAEALLPIIIDGWALTMLRCATEVRAWIDKPAT